MTNASTHREPLSIRLRIARIQAGLDIDTLVSRVNEIQTRLEYPLIDAKMIENIEAGRQRRGRHGMITVAFVCDVSAEWLLIGSGHMLDRRPTSDVPDWDEIATPSLEMVNNPHEIAMMLANQARRVA